ncbi:putative duf917-domain-containing protein [Eutypa lata UCREL1]|uniref:Putative duf917-domain-containing protein n=1 Tax=Eutypa lata (strain UCR-EL1) TaxID=1287681 RepID=M7SS09_EUTLA|nr:putative duf917-domain-containing protein [Eutypa lata UCREL1]
MRGIQTAIWTGKPLVDADLMGRAYPNLWQVTPNNAGISLAPAAASDAKGNTILSTYPGKRILTGKITRVTRDVRSAFTEGSLEIVPFATTTPEYMASSETSLSSPSQAKRIKITFQNENIHAFDAENGVTLASVPDLISVLDAEDGTPLGTQDYRYGLRVHVIALVGSPQWTEGEGLKNGGPEAFGLDIAYVPAAIFREPMSVIQRFNKG